MPDSPVNSAPVLLSMDVEAPSLKPVLGVKRFLSVIDNHSIPATFFTTGTVANSNPGFMKDLNQSHHEVASHGFSHPSPGDQSLPNYDTERKKTEVRKSFQCLDELGIRARGIRFPSFRVDEELLRLADNYFEYDSSSCPRGPGLWSIEDSLPESMGLDLQEVPVSPLVPYLNLPFGSPIGFSLPRKFLLYLISNGTFKTPLVIYTHSYDLVELHLNELPFPKWKKFVYYRHCGPDRARLFDTLIRTLKRQNYNFMTFSDYLDNQ